MTHPMPQYREGLDSNAIETLSLAESFLFNADAAITAGRTSEAIQLLDRVHEAIADVLYEKPLEVLCCELERRGFAPTWGDEGGVSLWVALEWPGDSYDRRIELTDNLDGTLTPILRGPKGRHDGTCHYCNADGSNNMTPCDETILELTLAPIDGHARPAAQWIEDFCRITGTAFDHFGYNWKGGR